MKTAEWFGRIGVFGTFLGHGIIALTSAKWVYLLLPLGIDVVTAHKILPFIGCLDILVAIWILLKPNRIVLIWAVFWAFITAVARVYAGDAYYEFIERASNWCLPLIFIFIKNGNLKKHQ